MHPVFYYGGFSNTLTGTSRLASATMMRHEVRVVLSATCQGAKDVAAAHNAQNHGGIQLRLLHADTTRFRLLVAF